MAAAQSIKIEMDYETKQTFKKLTRAIEHQNELKLEELRMQVKNLGGENYHDDQTLTKFRDAIKQEFGNKLSHREITELISAVQNVGILIRERRPSDG
jgi:ribosome maturation protein Sdo1